jgi:hypothetical protein
MALAPSARASPSALVVEEYRDGTIGHRDLHRERKSGLVRSRASPRCEPGEKEQQEHSNEPQPPVGCPLGRGLRAAFHHDEGPFRQDVPIEELLKSYAAVNRCCTGARHFEGGRGTSSHGEDCVAVAEEQFGTVSGPARLGASTTRDRYDRPLLGKRDHEHLTGARHVRSVRQPFAVRCPSCSSSFF